MKLWKYSVREAQKRPLRTLLTLLGIALGLATVVATRLTIHTIDRAYQELFEETVGPPALVVTAPGEDGFAVEQAAVLEGIAGIERVVPRIQAVAAVSGKAGKVSVPVLGIEAEQILDWPLRSGQPPTGRDQVLLDLSLAEALGLKAGDWLPLWSPTGKTFLRLAGILEPRGTAMGRVIMPLATAQTIFDLPNQITSFQVLLKQTADLETIRARIAPRLPPGLTVQGPGQRGQMAHNALFATEQGLGYLSLVALVVAGFVVLNTFLLNLSERRPQLALLRTLGATCRQIMKVLLQETVLFGLVGTLTGWVGGVGLSLVLLRLMEGVSGLALPGLELIPGPFLVTLVLGPGTALVVALVPAWLASRRQPLDELRPPHLAPCKGLPGICRLGLVFLGFGVLGQIGLCLDWLPGSAAADLQGPVIAFLLGGGVLALPLLILPLLRFLERLPLGLEGNLALKLLARHPSRTALTAGVLFLSLALAVGFGHCIQGIARDLRRWYGQTIVADFLVRASMPDTSFTLASELPEKLGREIEQVNAVAAVDKICFETATVNDQEVLVIARTFTPGQPLPLDLQEGSPAAVREGLQRGEGVLGTNLAHVLGVHRGDTVTLQTSHGPEALHVAGTTTEYAVGGMVLYLDWQTAGKFRHISGVHIFLVSAQGGAIPQADSALQAFCRDHDLLLQSNAEMHGQVDRLMERILYLLWALVALAFFVSSLGVVNTLTMNVQEQCRDLGILRALGLKGRQIGRVVLTQALLVACLGLVPGALAGCALAYVINVNAFAWGGHAIPFQPDFLVIAVSWGLTLTTALLAALLPAWKAARLPVIRGLQH